MERQRFFHVLEINEFGDFAVGIAGDVHYRAVPIGRRSEPMDRHDREKLPERPVIEQRLEHREVANVLIGQGRLRGPSLHRARNAGHDAC